MRQSTWSSILGLGMAIGASRSACGAGAPGNGPGTSDGGSDAVASDGGLDGDVPTDGGDGADSLTVPTVSVVSSFVNVLPSVVLDIACTQTDCYFAENGLKKLANGATTPSPLPAFPFGAAFGIESVVTVGAQVFTHAEYNVGTTDFTSQVVVLNGSAWTSIGAPRKTVPVAASLFADSNNVYAGVSGGGMAEIAVSANQNAAWTIVPGGMTSPGRFPVVDAQGALWARFGLQTYRIRPGESSWTAVGSPWPARGSGGRALFRAANGDLWYAGTSFVGKLALGATEWTSIALPAGVTGKTSAIVVDGSNTAYFGIGEPHKLLKIASGATTAIDTGVVIDVGRYCGAVAIDGTGRLLFSCYSSDVPDGQNESLEPPPPECPPPPL